MCVSLAILLLIYVCSFHGVQAANSEWMGGWMDGLVGEWMDEWMDRCIDE